ncbi:MAG: right-handed parallel beta-helix repeat-containing protein [Planctomycetaceae bacterium]|nr:right-handed parallel beta-helix repeat-containing protein [Planctomycetaceae bacterium]
MSKTKRNVFAALLLSWASLNPAFAQGPAASPGTATLDGGSSGYSVPGGGTGTPTPMGNGYYGQTFEPSGPQYAQQPAYNPYYSGMVPNYANDSAYTGYVPYDPFSSRLLTRSDIGTGLGYQNGYQTFAGMLPIMLNPDYSVLFATIRGNVGYDDSYGFNAGAGLRWYNEELDRVFGGSFWFDDDKRNPERYQQFGISAESLGTYFDFRINAYMPTNTNERLISKDYTGEVFFINHNLGLGQRTVFQSPMRGGDFEVGGAMLPFGDFGMRGYLGSYYFDGDGVGSGSMVGFKGRMEAMVTEDLWVQLGVTNDKYFGTNTTMAVTIFLPDGSPDRIMSRQPTRERLYVPVERNYRVTVHEHLLTDPELAINPRTGLPFYIDHVDNTNPLSGDGTVENPFDSLPGSRPGTTDIIYVHSGDGTDTNMTGGITLADYQRLWGDGVTHTVHAVQGDFDFLTGTAGVLPHITNIFGNAVTLANFNEVSGFRIDSPLGSGIYGSGITDFDINNVHVTGAGSHGIELINATNTPGTPGTITLSSFLDNTLDGIHIENTNGSSLEVDTTENTINRNLLVGIEAIADNGSSIDIGIGLTNLNENSIGFEGVATNGSAITAVVSDTTATNNLTSGIEMHANGSMIDLTVSGSEAALNVTNGVFLEGLNASNVSATILDSILVGNRNNGLLAEADSSLIEIVATGNQFNLNAENGMRVTASNSSLFNTILTSNEFDNNGLNGLLLTLNSLSIGNIVAENNSFSNNNTTNTNGSAGVNLFANSGSTLTSVFTLNDFDSNNGFGFALTSKNSTHVTTIGGPSPTDDRNTFSSNVGAAISINQVDTGTGSLVIQNNEILGTTDDGNSLNDFWGDAINVRLNGTNAKTSLTSALIDGNLIGSSTNETLGNAGRGVYFYAEDFTTLSNVIVSSNLIYSNGDNGIEFTRRNNATINNIVISDNTISGSQINTDRLTTIAAVLTDPWIGQFSGNGIFITASGSNVDDTFTPLLDDYLISGNFIEKNEMNGIHLRVESDANLLADIANNDILTNASNGILTSERLNDLTDLRSITGNWTGNTITGNAGIADQSTGVFVGLNNTGNGIRIAAQTDGLNIGLDALGLGNTIMNNGGNIDRTINLINRLDSGNGIDITSSGTLSIANNLISNNFKGIHITNSFIGQLLDFTNIRTITLTNNEIIDNRDDGLESTLGTLDLGDFVSIIATENVIANNAGRGVDVFNTTSATTWLQFGDGTMGGRNVIEGNAYEGFYVVNTSAQATITAGQFVGDMVLQDLNDAVSTLQRDGAVTARPDVVMDLQYNRIQGNGALSSHFGTGVVLYVGTSGGGLNAPFFDGELGSDTLAGNGRVNARIVNNEFGGNAGSDFYVQSFTSTVDPVTTQATWAGADVNPSAFTAFQNDPLARLNMVFRGNTGDGIEATTSGIFGASNEAAWYDNDESNFKSRVNTNTPPGPFQSGTRRRNAQRLGADLNIPFAATNFSYPGTGLSTFRIESDVDISGFTSGIGFILDGSPVPPNYSGATLPGSLGPFDETPYGWGSVAVGTFQFLIP